jgi:hypothetical protein
MTPRNRVGYNPTCSALLEAGTPSWRMLDCIRYRYRVEKIRRSSRISQWLGRACRAVVCLQSRKSFEKHIRLQPH